MHIKPSELHACALEHFLTIFSNEVSREHAVLQRQTLHLNVLEESMEGIARTMAISLNMAKQLNLLDNNGEFVAGEPRLKFRMDSARLEMDGLLSQNSFTAQQKLLIDSISFSASARVPEVYPYNKVQANMFDISCIDIELYSVIKDMLFGTLQKEFLKPILQFIRFDEDGLTVECQAAIKAQIKLFRNGASTETGIEIDDALLIKDATTDNDRINYSETKVIEYQNKWIEILKIDPESLVANDRAEYDAAHKLLSLWQDILKVSLQDKGWKVFWQLFPRWINTGENYRDFQWLPRRVAALVGILEAALEMDADAREPLHYQNAQDAAKAMINEYAPGYFSSESSQAFFAGHRRPIAESGDEWVVLDDALKVSA